jgi:hypothetical protein
MRKKIFYLLLPAAAAAALLVAASVLAQDEWPYAEAGGTYQVYEGDWVMLDASGSYGVNGVEPTYAWDLNNDGEFDTEGFSVWFDASARDGAASQVVNLQACVPIDEFENMCYTDLATVDILNATPQVDAGADVTLYSGQTFSLNGIFTDAGVSDSHIATVDYGNNSGTVSAGVIEDGGAGLVTGSRTYYAPSVRTVQVCVQDDDGGTGCDTLNVTVQPISVTIDIRPYFYPNTVNLQDTSGTLKAAVLTTDTFDASYVNAGTVYIAGAPIYVAWWEDINDDGRQDFVAKAYISQVNLNGSTTTAGVSGVTNGGRHFLGIDTIDIVPPPAPTTNVSSTYPTLYWSAINGAVCYQVEIDNNSDFSSPEQVATNVEGYYYNVDPLPSGTYYWRVRVGGVCVGVLQSGWSASRTFTVP